MKRVGLLLGGAAALLAALSGDALLVGASGTVLLSAASGTVLLSAASVAAAPRDRAAEVRAAETAFAKTMADRDVKAFEGYVSKEGVFFGAKGPLRGRTAIVERWKQFFEGADAPFSWGPETVEVLPSGKLALTSGPVHDPKGALIGTFNSIWRLESDGKWRVVFDKGCPVCEEKSGS